MGPRRRRLLVAVAVLLPALLVYGARQIGSPDEASGLPGGVPPVFVGRVVASDHGSRGVPVPVRVEIRADRTIDLAGLRLLVSNGEPAEITSFTVGPTLRTVPFDVIFTGRGKLSLTLQVRLSADAPWVSLPSGASVIVA